MSHRIFVLDRSALPGVELVRALAPGAPVEVVADAFAGATAAESSEPRRPSGRAPLDAGQLASFLGLEHEDLVAVGPLLQHPAQVRAELVVRLAIQHGAFVLSVGSHCPTAARAARHVGVVSDGEAADLTPLAAVLQRFDGAARVTGFLSREGHGRRGAFAAALEAARPGRVVSIVELGSLPRSHAHEIDAAAADAGVDLVVVASDAVSDASALVRGFFAADALQQAERPMLVLPRATRAPGLLADRIVVSDALVLPGAPAWVAVERDGPLGRLQLAPADRLRFGERLLDHVLGVVAVPADETGAPEGRLSLASSPDHRCLVRALLPTRPLLLVDARAPTEVLASIERLASETHVVFVRLRWADPLEALQRKLMERAPWAGVPTLIDASAWLGDGGAGDLPEEVDPLRLARLARRLRSLGARIGEVVGGAPALAAPDRDAGSFDRIEGNDVRFDVDNRIAREALLAAVAGARRTVHCQTYLVEGGAVTARVAEALIGAASRGVKVRLLIDALYSLHDVLIARNPVLERLAAVEGIDVCAYRPVTGLPDLVALKQRNHRKLVVVDDEWAVVTGRNLGAPYYTGFGEVALTRSTSYRDVPWLDCGVRLRGPIVGEVQRAFRASWIASGGSPFEAGPVPARAGTTPCRLVLHEGLRDTHTFDTQLDLIRRARARIVAVNAFPFAVELQQALVEALRRGVRVQVLFGSVRPKWGADRPFAGGVIRELADQLIRARLDPVLRAGGEVGELAMEPLPGWEPKLGRVYPYVHAKVLVRDGEEAAVGSANFDVTSAYWESEAILVVEDAAAVTELLAQIEPLLASARRSNPADERWQRQAERRALLDRVWPSLVG